MENLGYLATFFIILSFTTKDIKKLRILNLIGTLLYLIYSLITGQKPLIIVNSFVAIIHLYNLLVDTRPGRSSKKWAIEDWF